jgi:glycosyl transferase family 25
MKIFFTNLKGYEDRKDFMIKQLSDFKLDYEIIDCIDGRNWEEGYIKSIVTPKLFEMYNRYKDTWLTKGAIAATLTHVELIYKKIVAENIEYALILEDDVTLNKDFPVLLKQLEEHLYHKKIEEIVLLYSIPGENNATLLKSSEQKVLNPYNLYTPKVYKIGFGGAYVIHNSAAKRLIAAQSPINYVADWWESHYKAKTINELYVMYPFPCHTGDFESTLGYKKNVFANAFRFFKLDTLIRFFRKKGIHQAFKVE